MKYVILSSLLGVCFSSPSIAQVSPPNEAPSRAFQLAKRVANMENEHGQPSRAVWLGQRVAKNSIRLASKEQSKPKKKPRVISN